MNFLCTYNCSFLHVSHIIVCFSVTIVPPPSFASVAATFLKADSSKKAGGMVG